MIPSEKLRSCDHWFSAVLLPGKGHSNDHGIEFGTGRVGLPGFMRH